jgi:hypothetical protein
MVLIIVQGEGFGPPILQYGFLVYVVMYRFATNYTRICTNQFIEVRGIGSRTLLP